MLNIAIVGAGIGGLVAAIAIKRIGHDVTVYEQTQQLGEIGAGITIATEACRILNWLGLESQLNAMEEPTPHLGTLHFETAERLSYEVRDIEAWVAEHGTATRHVHRADLHHLLVNEYERFGTKVKLSHKLNELSQDANCVNVVFDNGVNTSHDVLIGCDGLKSAVRDASFDTEKPTYTGMVAWRGLVDRGALPHIDFDPHFAAVPAAGKMFARYPLRRGELINYVAIARQPDVHLESWTAQANVADVLRHFEGWHRDFYDIIAATDVDQCLQWALRTREPLSTWINGRITLLGDAAHPMTPFYGRGAMMAIEDACVLGRCLQSSGDNWQQAFRRYEEARLERANAIHRMSSDRGRSYLSDDPQQRAKPVTDGLDAPANYDALTVALP